jgi:hypothetical protein
VLAADLDMQVAFAEIESKFPGLAGHMESGNPGMHTSATPGERQQLRQGIGGVADDEIAEDGSLAKGRPRSLGVRPRSHRSLGKFGIDHRFLRDRDRKVQRMDNGVAARHGKEVDGRCVTPRAHRLGQQGCVVGHRVEQLRAEHPVRDSGRRIALWLVDNSRLAGRHAGNHVGHHDHVVDHVTSRPTLTRRRVVPPAGVGASHDRVKGGCPSPVIEAHDERIFRAQTVRARSRSSDGEDRVVDPAAVETEGHTLWEMDPSDRIAAGRRCIEDDEV